MSKIKLRKVNEKFYRYYMINIYSLLLERGNRFKL
jgi:hypothetical protein